MFLLSVFLLSEFDCIIFSTNCSLRAWDAFILHYQSYKAYTTSFGCFQLRVLDCWGNACLWSNYSFIILNGGLNVLLFQDLFLIYLRFSVLITDVITWKPVSSLKQFDILRPGLIATTNLFLTHYQTHGAIRIFGNCFYNHFMSGTSAQLSDNLITSVFTSDDHSRIYTMELSRGLTQLAAV